MADQTPNTPVPLPAYGQPGATSGSFGMLNGVAHQQDATMTDAQSAEKCTNFPSTSAQPSSSATAPNGATSQFPSTATQTGTSLRNTSSTAAAAMSSTANGTNFGAAPSNTMDNFNANSSSRATSLHPDTGFTMPLEAPPHGAPVRQYLNSKVTTHVLDGMKKIAKEQPKDPLRALAEFLMERSKDIETQT
ncbi:Uu.00g048390.m01.CDS01 [Anthostomella pinea]|uniref:Uu.00g048390.m01.CDS01 n=1 Tax=Anthostomella pinea TaxID=933095 RepID=A0AAI8VCQ0_9PEZI|nr:Uu.00g048390.m01.CDS01 [Anthostomella pinea]